jgi:hypothetical protein
MGHAVSIGDRQVKSFITQALFCFIRKVSAGAGWNFLEAYRNRSPPEVLIGQLAGFSAFIAVAIVP